MIIHLLAGRTESGLQAECALELFEFRKRLLAGGAKRLRQNAHWNYQNKNTVQLILENTYECCRRRALVPTCGGESVHFVFYHGEKEWKLGESFLHQFTITAEETEHLRRFIPDFDIELPSN